MGVDVLREPIPFGCRVFLPPVAVILMAAPIRCPSFWVRDSTLIGLQLFDDQHGDWLDLPPVGLNPVSLTGLRLKFH